MRNTRGDDKVYSIKDLVHVCHHASAHSLSLNEALRFEAFGNAQCDSDISCHLAPQAVVLKLMHVT